MNILTDMMPDWVTIEGKSYPVRTDFRVWLEFDKVIHSAEIKAEDKAVILFRLCFDSKNCRFLPSSPHAAMSALSNFYMCGHTEKSAENKSGNKCRVFSFEEDADYIYAAFLSQYGIDLVSIPYMHWYRFSALFKGIDDGSRLMKIISVRAADINSPANSGRQKYLRKMKELYALSDTRTEEEREYDMAEALSELF
ncbi:MAG: hypothetical protein J6C82_03620 [Clostridia bacterium]|nr:hypothetical protein [Clostridia bacterium]